MGCKGRVPEAVAGAGRSMLLTEFWQQGHCHCQNWAAQWRNPLGLPEMIRTFCAACAAPLAHTAPRCGRCHTRYCGPACQELHWREGGHNKDICKKIKRAGGAEQYYADKKCAEAVAVAVEACVDDTKGQACYICLEAVHPKTKEGLVRGCACGDREGVDSGTTGIAHVSCLAEQAKVLVAEAEENNLGVKVKNERRQWWRRAACASRITTASLLCTRLGVLENGTWVGQRRTGLHLPCGSLGKVYTMQNITRTRRP